MSCRDVSVVAIGPAAAPSHCAPTTSLWLVPDPEPHARARLRTKGSSSCEAGRPHRSRRHAARRAHLRLVAGPTGARCALGRRHPPRLLHEQDARRGGSTSATLSVIAIHSSSRTAARFCVPTGYFGDGRPSLVVAARRLRRRRAGAALPHARRHPARRGFRRGRARARLGRHGRGGSGAQMRDVDRGGAARDGARARRAVRNRDDGGGRDRAAADGDRATRRASHARRSVLPRDWARTTRARRRARSSRSAGAHGAPIETVAVGDAANDVPMLLAADAAIVVASPQAAGVAARVPGARLTHTPGPSGWNDAILAWLGS